MDRTVLRRPTMASGDGGAALGAPAPDGPLGNRWLFDGAGGGFRLLAFEADVAGEPGVETVLIGRGDDHAGVLWQRYDAQPGTVYLLRPDRHVAARWRRYDAQAVRTALRRAMAA